MIQKFVLVPLRLALTIAVLAAGLTAAGAAGVDGFGALSVGVAQSQTCPPASVPLTNFGWSSAPGGTDDPATDGATWPADTVTKTWNAVGGTALNVTATISDPANRNNDTATAGVNIGAPINAVDEFLTSTNENVANDGVYGSDFLSLVMHSASVTEEVSMTFDFSIPVFFASGFSVDDIDSVGFNPAPAATNEEESFQDELTFTASDVSGNVPITVTQVAGTLVAVNGQTATGGYTTGVNGNVTPNDPEGQVTVASDEPFTSLTITYRDGPDDRADELASPSNPGTWDGVSNGHAVRIGGFELCEPFASGISLDKTVYNGHSTGVDCASAGNTLAGVVPGQNITYCFEVTNTGDVDLDSFAIDDAALGLSGATPPTIGLVGSPTFPVAPGGTVTYYYETGAPAADLTNSATATANPVYADGSDIPFLGDVDATDTADVTVLATGIALVKALYAGHDTGASCGAATANAQLPVGADVTYCFTVTNNSAVPITNVGVDDTTLGSPAISSTTSPYADPLAAGASVTFYYETAVAGALVNTATATGTPSNAGGTPIPGATPLTVDDNATVVEADSSLSLAKTAAIGATCPGSESISPTAGTAISYCFTVSNTGDTHLTNVTIADADIPGFTPAALIPVSGSLSSIPPGGSATVRYATTATVDVLPNTATATGTPSDSSGNPYGISTVSDTDTANVDVQNPAVEIIKTVVLDGAACPGVDGATLAVADGADVTYCFEVNNTGDTALTNVTVADVGLGFSGSVADLAVGASASTSFGPVAATDLVNTASVAATPADGSFVAIPGGANVTDSDTAATDVQTPGLSLDKTVAAGAGAACPGAELVTAANGVDITYCFVLTNTGESHLDLGSLSLTDATLGIDETDLTVVGTPNDPLPTGETATYRYSTTVSGDLVNTASASLDPVLPDGSPLPGATPTNSGPDTAEVDQVNPAIDIVKTVYSGHDSGGGCAGANAIVIDPGAVTYCFAVTNTSVDTFLKDVTVDDVALSTGYPGSLTLASGDPSLMAPNDVATFYFETNAAADLTNTASTTGTPSTAGGVTIPGAAPTADDTANVDVVDPAITLAKTVYAGHDGGASCPTSGELVQGENGDDVTYCFVIENTGDTYINGVTVADTDLGITLNAPVLLAPGDSTTLFHDATITGDLVNTATATGTPSTAAGATLVGVQEPEDSDTAEVDELAPGVSIEKTAYLGADGGASCAGDEVAVVEVGDDVTYCFLVTNTGDTALADLVIDDPTLGLSIDSSNELTTSGTLASLAIGASAEVYVETVAGAADVTNIASVAGNPVDPGGADLPGLIDPTDADDAVLNVVAPSLGISKTVSVSGSCPGVESALVTFGQAVTYCFAITNTGDVHLADVTIDDDIYGTLDGANTMAVTGSLALIAPSETVTVAYAANAPVSDLTNTAAAIGIPADAGGTPIGTPAVTSPTDTADLVVVVPDISVEKTVYAGHDAGVSCVGAELVSGVNGDAVTYCFVVENTGDTHLTDVTVDDADLGVSLPVPGPIAPGGTATVFTESTIAGDLINSADATGDPSDAAGVPLPGISDVTSPVDTAEVNEIGPAIAVAKTVYAGHDTGASCPAIETVSGQNGDPVTYCFVVTNIGDTHLTDITVDDATLGISLPVPGPIAPGGNATVFTESTISGDLLNFATSTGDPSDAAGVPLPGVASVIANPDTAAVVEVAPAIAVAKTVYAGHDAGVSCAGAEVVTGVNGDAVTYCFVVENTGDTHLTDVTVDDAALGVSLPVPGPIAPGGTATVFTESTIAGDLLNSADATGDPSDAAGVPLTGIGDVTSPLDTAAVLEVAPDISVEKTVYAGHDAGASCVGAELVSGVNGDAVTYCFVVENTGDTHLTDVTVDDADLGVSLPVPGPIAPGGTATVFTESTITGDLINSADATGDPSDAAGVPLPGISDVTSPVDTAEVNEIGPAIAVAKTVYAGHDAGASCVGAELVSGVNGDAVTYCFVVENTGDTHLTDVTVDDADLGVSLPVPGPIAPGGTATVFTESTIAGDLINSADATGDPSDAAGVPLPGISDVTSPVDTAEVNEVAPSIAIDKTVYAGHDAGGSCVGTELVSGLNGDAVTYCFVVENTGDTHVANVAVTDTTLGLNLPVAGPIAPGATATVFTESTIAGDLVNFASATGDPSDAAGVPLPDVGPVSALPDSAEVNEIGPAISVEKTVYAGHDAGASCAGNELVSGLNGDAVTYCFVVENTGDTHLTDVTVDDAVLGISLPVPGPIAPGGTATVFTESTIAGDLINSADATGDPSDAAGVPIPGAADVTAPVDTAEVVVVAPAIAVAKSVYAGHDAGASCAGNELVSGLNGDAVTYCFVVENTGDTHLTDVTVDDAVLGISLPVPGPIAPGGTATVFTESTITGDLINSADATGDPSDAAGVPLPNLASVTSPVDTAEVAQIAPAIAVAKTVYAGHDVGASCSGAESVTGLNGDAVTYCFLVTNTGDTHLANITVDDADLGVSLPVPGPIAPGGAATVFTESTITGDLLNSADATGDPSNDAGVPYPDTSPVTSPLDTAVVNLVGPGVTMTKTASTDGTCPGVASVSIGSGSTVTYCFEVVNTGDTHLDSISFTDPNLSSTPTPTAGAPALPLAPGATIMYAASQPVGATVVNNASVNAVPTANDGTPLGVPPVSDAGTAEVVVLAPSVQFEKTVTAGASCPGTDSLSAGAGTAVLYCFVVTNDGNADLDAAALTIVDATLGITEADLTPIGTVPAVLTPGQSASFSYDSTAPVGGIVNSADLTIAPLDDMGAPLPGPGGNPVPPLTATDTAEVVEVEFGIAVAKTIYVGHDSGASCGGAELQNVAAGSAVTYCFAVTNTSATAYLADVTVDDVDLGVAYPGAIVLLAGDPTLLAPGATASFYFEATAAATLTNNVDVSGSPAEADGTLLPVVSDPTATDPADVVVVAPALSLAKTVYAGSDLGAGCPTAGDSVVGDAGDIVTYCFVVTNTGDTAINSIEVDDADLGITLTDPATLAVGESVTLFTEVALTTDLLNTATATGAPSTPTGAPLPGMESTVLTDDDTAVVDVVAPGLTVGKTVYAGHDAGASCAGSELVTSTAGSPVTYCFVVLNTGDTSLDSVTFSDPALGIPAGTALTPVVDALPLAVGESATFFVEDLLNQDLLNTVEATAVPVDGGGTPLPGVDPPTNTDTASVDLVGPGVAIAKTVSVTGSCPGGELAIGQAGDGVTYCFNVSNTGDTHLTDIVVLDLDLGIDDSAMTLETGTLPLVPGESAMYSYSTTLAGDLVNTASVNATPSDPAGVPLTGLAPVTDSDIAEVDEVAPAITLAKTASTDGTCPGVELAQVAAGADVTWCLEVSNSGDTRLAVLEIDDPLAGVTAATQSSLVTPDPATVSLDPTESVVFTVTTTATADATNTATVGATPVDAGDVPLGPTAPPVSDTDDAAVDVLTPAIALSKTVSVDGTCPGLDSVQAGLGFAVTYCFAVTNTGDTSLNPVDVTDAALGITAGSLSAVSVVDDDNALPLAPGGVAYFEAPATVAGDLLNTATAIGAPIDDAGAPLPGPGGQPADPVEATDTAAVLASDTGIFLSKTVVAGTDTSACPGVDLLVADAGADVVWCFVVTNTSTNVSLANVDLVDTALGLADATGLVLVAGDPALVAPGDSVVWAFAGTASALANTATATGIPADPTGTPLPSVETPTFTDGAEIQLAAPAVELAKTVVLGTDATTCPGTELVTGPVGADVTYCFTVTNTGDTVLVDIAIADPAIGVNLTEPGPLAPGDSMLLSAAATIDGDLVNTATANAIPADPAGNPLPAVEPVEATDTAEVDSVDPGITVAKTVYEGDDAGAGCASATDEVIADHDAEVTWCFTVTNSGENTVTELTLDDPQLDLQPADLTLVSGALPLLPGEEITYAATSIITETIENTVTAIATIVDRNGDPIPGLEPPTSTSSATATQRPFDLVLAKSLASTDTSNRLATWRITVVNDGPGLAVGPLTLVDELPAGLSYVSSTSSEWSCTNAGSTVTCTYPEDLAIGPVLTLDLVTSVAANATGTIVNDAEVSSPASVLAVNGVVESRLENNVGQAQLQMGAPASPGSPTPLPNTGGDPMPLTRVAIFFLLAGALLVLGGRKLKQHS